MMSRFSLHDLASIIDARAASGGEASYTRKLLDKGTEHCAKKFGEEAVEAVIAAIGDNRDHLSPVILQPDPVLQAAEVVPEVQRPGRPVAGQHPCRSHEGRSLVSGGRPGQRKGRPMVMDGLIASFSARGEGSRPYPGRHQP